MRLTFLGTGTSAGVPCIGCACEVCRSIDPRDTRTRTSAALRFTDTHGRERTILLDCGPDMRAQALANGLTRCDAVLFTHNHVDHTFGVDELRRFNAVMRQPIDIYAEAHTLTFLRRVYAHIFDRDKNFQDSFVATLTAHVIEPEAPINLFGLRITPLRFLHGKLPIAGFRLDAGSDLPASRILPLVYATDVNGVPPETWRHLTDLQTLVLGALRHRKHPTHYTLDEAVDVADRIAAEQTFFVHMSHELGHAVTQASLPENMHLAHDGLVLG
ncbi:MAG: MBL fold metallo-hydrolase [Phycisphaeraceae bacterium]|nr:MBL fold metallo-hydrolase [Phycisphaeraceae bacterium]MCW5755528.1 MBL fold metallo-hydrolase [Phycisphaeraceae bacterium]